MLDRECGQDLGNNKIEVCGRIGGLEAEGSMEDTEGTRGTAFCDVYILPSCLHGHGVVTVKLLRGCRIRGLEQNNSYMRVTGCFIGVQPAKSFSRKVYLL